MPAALYDVSFLLTSITHEVWNSLFVHSIFYDIILWLVSPFLSVKLVRVGSRIWFLHLTTPLIHYTSETLCEHDLLTHWPGVCQCDHTTSHKLPTGTFFWALLPTPSYHEFAFALHESLGNPWTAWVAYFPSLPCHQGAPPATNFDCTQWDFHWLDWPSCDVSPACQKEHS